MKLKRTLALVALFVPIYVICSILAGAFFGVAFALLHDAIGVNPPLTMLRLLISIGGLVLAVAITEIIRRRRSMTNRADAIEASIGQSQSWPAEARPMKPESLYRKILYGATDGNR